MSASRVWAWGVVLTLLAVSLTANIYLLTAAARGPVPKAHRAASGALPISVAAAPEDGFRRMPTASQSPVAEDNPAPALPSEAKPASRTSTDALVAELPAVAAAIGQKLASVRVDLLDKEGKLTAAFKTLFAITPEEAQRMQDAIEQGKRMIDQLAAQHTSLTRADEKAVVITTSAFDGTRLYDPVLDSFRPILGEERYRSFGPLMEREVQQAMSFFGAERRTFTVTREADATFQIAERRTSGTIDGVTTGSSSRLSFRNADSLIEAYHWLAPMLGSIHQLSPPPPVPGR